MCLAKYVTVEVKPWNRKRKQDCNDHGRKNRGQRARERRESELWWICRGVERRQHPNESNAGDGPDPNRRSARCRNSNRCTGSKEQRENRSLKGRLDAGDLLNAAGQRWPKSV